MVATLASQFFIIWMMTNLVGLKTTILQELLQLKILKSWATIHLSNKHVLCRSFCHDHPDLTCDEHGSRKLGKKLDGCQRYGHCRRIYGRILLKTKLEAFAISAFYCGVAGALFAFTYLKSLEPVAFDIKLSFKVMFMVILGGLGTINGAFIGGAFILLFPVVLNAIGNNVFHGMIDATIISSIEQVVFGALMIIFMIYEPLGMSKLWDNLKLKFSTKAKK